MATIIFTHGGGRFGNQMFTYSQLLAFAFEYQDVDFVNLACWEYADLLEISRQDPLCTKSLNLNRYKFLRFLQVVCKKLFIKNESIAKRFIIYIIYLYGGNPFAKYYNLQAISALENDFLLAQKVPNIDLATSKDAMYVTTVKTTLLSGWGICDWKLVEKHQNKIREILKIRQKYHNVSDQFISDKRKEYDFIVGVMIRHGDYQTWGEGCYYYSIQQYVNWLNRLREIFEDRGKIGFIIASDSPQDLKSFGRENVHFTTGIAGSDGHYLESLLQLSMCDIVVSAPSTFTAWAAFLGKVPLLLLLKPDQLLQEDQILENHLFDFVNLQG
jgi:Glycosyl transferase family 11